MELGSGSEGIGTKSLSQSLSERAFAEHELERASALERALELDFPQFEDQHLDRDEDDYEDEFEYGLFLDRVLAVTHRARALTNERAVALERTRVLQPMAAVPQNQSFDLNAVLADLGIMEIINSMKSRDRYKLAHILWHHSPQKKHEYPWLFLLFAPINRLPPELLQQILLIVIDEVSDSPSVLTHVCRHWHAILTGIWASLKLGTKTTKDDVIRKLERNQWLLDIFVDTEMDRGDSAPSYEAIFTVIEVVSRWRSFIVETFPGQADLPEDLVNHGLQRCSNASMSRLRIFKIKCACEMSPLLDRLLHILGATASPELIRVEIASINVISLLARTYPSIFHSIKALYLDTPGMTEPVDLLPHLKQLETFTASQLCLSACPLDMDLPLVHTLSQLKLRGVSIQWMAGRTFHALKSCILFLPVDLRSVHTRGTLLPHCEDLFFEGRPLETLEGFSVNMVTRLAVRGQEYSKKHGNKELAFISKHFLSVLALRSLQIGVTASSQALIEAFASMPHLEELILTNLLPTSLHGGFFRAFIAKPPDEHNRNTSLALGEWHTRFCPKLKVFGLSYKRWLRSTEEFNLAPTLMEIKWSRGLLQNSLDEFYIRFTGGQKEPLDLIDDSVKAFDLMASSIYVERGQPFSLVERNAVQTILRHATASTQRHFLTPPSLAVKQPSKPLPLHSEHGYPGYKGASTSYYDSSDDSLDYLPTLGPSSGIKGECPGDLDSPVDSRKDGEDWFAYYNPREPQSLNISLVFQVNHSDTVDCVRFSKDGLWLATGCNSTVQIFDMRTRTLSCTLIDESGPPTVNKSYLEVCFSPDSKYLAATGFRGLIQIWDIARENIHYTFKGHQKDIYALDFSNDGSFIVSVSSDETVRIWNMTTRESKVLPIDGPGTSVAISPDSRFVVAGSEDGVVRIWDVATGTLVTRLKGHGTLVRSLAFTPDGKGLVSCSEDMTLKYWEFSVALSDTHQTVMRHSNTVPSVAISHDGQWIVSGCSVQCGVQFWDRHGRSHLMLQGHHDYIESVDLSPTGGYLATGSDDRRTRVWRYSTI